MKKVITPQAVSLEILGVPVMILRKPQKNMYLSVRSDGTVRVTCPPSTADLEIRQFVTSHVRWILRRRNETAQTAETGLHEGSLLPVWGKFLPLKITAERPFGVSMQRGGLTMRAPENSTGKERAALMQSFRRAEMNRAIPPLIRRWAPLLGVSPSAWHLREMSSRWGSCSIRTGRLCFNLRLSEKDPLCLEYVVVHELCHLLVPDHSRAFWNYVAHCLPDWRQRRKLTNAAPQPPRN
ncbi:MAG: M48 family metallopeptidase [Pyramidobacter sp.]|jgi:predicted metal-dependent hydrolase